MPELFKPFPRNRVSLSGFIAAEAESPLTESVITFESSGGHDGLQITIHGVTVCVPASQCVASILAVAGPVRWTK